MNVFLDTNILLDVLARRDPFFESASRIWLMSEEKLIAAYVSAISFNNIYYIIRKLEGRGKANRALGLMRKIFRVVAVDERLLDEAMTSKFDDFEDAIQYRCAMRCRASALITRNPRHFPSEGMKIMTGAQFLRGEPAR